MGLCLVKTNGDNKPSVIKKATLKNGSLSAWQSGLPSLLDRLDMFVTEYAKEPIDKAGIEMIVWYGKRKGVLALAHLAGACLAHLRPRCNTVRFFLPKEVKATSLKYSAPKGFDEHQHDALSICRLLASEG